MKPKKHKFIYHCDRESWGKEIYIMEQRGKAFGRIYWNNDDKTTAYLAGLSVEMSSRKQGIGTELQELRESMAMGSGATITCLWVEKGTWMHEWYKRRGYKDCEDYEGLENHIWMRKDLTNN